MATHKLAQKSKLFLGSVLLNLTYFIETNNKIGAIQQNIGDFLKSKYNNYGLGFGNVFLKKTRQIRQLIEKTGEPCPVFSKKVPRHRFFYFITIH